MPARFRVHLIGRFRIAQDGTPLGAQEIGSRKGRTLLKILVLERNHVVPGDRIAEALWGDQPPPKWNRDLATLVSRLRAVFGAEAIAGGAGGYRFVPGDRFDVDLDEAERLVAESEGRLSAGEPSLARGAADRALVLLRAGGALEDEPYAEWAAAARDSAAALLRRARRCGWVAAMELSEFDRAAEVAEGGIAEDPLDEEAHRAVMLAVHRAGRSGQALAAYERLRSILAENVGADPAPQTQALHLAILREEPVHAEPVPGLLGRAAPSAEARPEAPDSGFVGRREELEEISRGWEQALVGQGSMLLLVGEAGIGKTTLAETAVGFARRTGGTVAHARCYDAERSLFLQPLVDAVRSIVVTTPPEAVQELAGEWAGTLADLVPEIGRILRPLSYQRATPEIERRRSFEGLASFFRSLARGEPVLLFLDDLHNAGASTLEFLHFLQRRAQGARLLVLATVRLEEGEGALAQLQDVSRRIDVGPLPEAAVTALAGRMGAAAMAPRLMTLTRGHPLFVVEVLRTIGDGPWAETAVPESLRGVVEGRVRRAGPDVEELLRVAATLGSSFDISVVARLLEAPLEDAARRAEQARRARLLVESGATYEFANDLIREILYRTTPLAVRVPRHRRAAALLAGNPEAVAVHASAAGNWVQARDAWVEAAERAAARFANRDAEELLDRALEAAQVVEDPGAEAQVRVARGRARERLAEFEGAFEDQALAVEQAREAGERSIELHALRELGGDLLIGLGRPTRACIPYLEAALEIAAAIEDRPAQVDILSRLAVVWVNRLRFDIAFDQAGRALTTARELGDEGVVAIALDGLKSACAYSGDLARLEPVLRELEPILRRRGQLLHLQWAVFESAFPPMARADWATAIGRIEAALDLNRKTGYVSYQPLYVAHLGWIHRSRGEYGRALSLGRQAVETADEIGHTWWKAFTRTMLGWTLTEVGAVGDAVRHLERGLAAAEADGAEAYVLRSLGHLALALCRDGQKERAAAALDRAGQIIGQIGAPPGMSFLHGADAILAAATVWFELGDWTAARRLVDMVGGPARTFGWREVEASAAVLAGRCSGASGDWKSAEQDLGDALDVAEGAGLSRVAWEAHVEMTGLAERRSDAEEAERHRSAAAEGSKAMATSIDDPVLRRQFIAMVRQRSTQPASAERASFGSRTRRPG